MSEKDELELIFPSESYREEVMEYLQEFFDNEEDELAGDGGLDKLKDYDKWLKKIRNDVSENTIEIGKVPSTVFLCIRKNDGKIVGNIQIRHKLNDYLLRQGGHIGDSIRPSERRKGYATEMIRLALEECKRLKIDKVLMTCDKDNIGSAKSIINNGGILENEILLDNGEICQRYWIDLLKDWS